ncbi:hypothetical protein M438DRAFT_109372 [Aureobasidium pullulans EXF-150]|uniref:Uncharacterized protein n=1 Tax=Aureobasidium pullulans EXF-150 TaxID=1043002 RepID=A0A074XES2_AURPU|nr:uncharacterized protein M438DRAFT_109372 [Aureobasidium pullulans EXF-150]KEQ80542.1 hypothetical protein M438DRAFT_109372 [Aureobasidium pullulans EXF-150]
MDSLAKETMGLPIFICPTNNQIISSGPPTQQQHKPKSSLHPSSPETSTANSTAYDSNNNIPASPTSSQISPTTASFFATASATRSPPSPPFSPLSTKRPRLERTTTSETGTEIREARRNTYTPPTFSPRRESLLSTKRLSQVFDYASGVVEGALKTVGESVFGEERGVREEVWRDDLENGDMNRKEEEQGGSRYRRFGEEGGFDGWLD